MGLAQRHLWRRSVPALAGKDTVFIEFAEEFDERRKRQRSTVLLLELIAYRDRCERRAEQVEHLMFSLAQDKVAPYRSGAGDVRQPSAVTLTGDLNVSGELWWICAVIGFHLGYDLHFDKRDP